MNSTRPLRQAQGRLLRRAQGRALRRAQGRCTANAGLGLVGLIVIRQARHERDQAKGERDGVEQVGEQAGKEWERVQHEWVWTECVGGIRVRACGDIGRSVHYRNTKGKFGGCGVEAGGCVIRQPVRQAPDRLSEDSGPAHHERIGARDRLRAGPSAGSPRTGGVTSGRRRVSDPPLRRFGDRGFGVVQCGSGVSGGGAQAARSLGHEPRGGFGAGTRLTV